MPILISFDIDGTLEIGDPAGPIQLASVRRALAAGCIVGSASDRVVSEQQKIWREHDIEMYFVVHKHHLDGVRDRFGASRYVHIGDTVVDERYARLHGFEFFLPAALTKIDPNLF